MFLIYCNKEINYKVKYEYEKFGLKINSLNKRQRDKIIKKYDVIVSYKKDLMNSFEIYDDGTFLFNRKRRKELEENCDLKKIIDLMVYNKTIPMFHKNVAKFINHLLVVDIDEDKISQFVEPRDIRLFLRQFINFHCIFDDDLEKKADSKNTFPYRYEKEMREKNIKFDDLIMEILFKYMFNFCDIESYGCFSVSEAFANYLNYMDLFISNLNKEKLFKFIEIMEMYFSNAKLPQNNILNDVLIMESLLISKDSNGIDTEFGLKVGMIYKISKLKKYYSNYSLSLILNYLYKIRSSIIHGSTEKIINIYDTFTKNMKEIECLNFKGYSKMNERQKILHFTEELSYQFLNIVLRYWIMNYSYVEFLKNN